MSILEANKIELRSPWTEHQLQQVFKAAYEQVFGRERVYIGNTFASAEALLRNGTINVRQFVAALAKSEFYKERFFYSNSQQRFIELNFKHLLGRAPYEQKEIAAHVDTYASSGYDDEIDSYIYSSEYDQAFGDHIVPYCRGFQSLPGMKMVGFSRFMTLCKGPGNSDNAQGSGSKSVLAKAIALGSPTSSGIATAASLKAAAVTGDSRVYLMEVTTGLSNSRVAVRLGSKVLKVPFEQLSQRYQQVHRQGGRILSISPL